MSLQNASSQPCLRHNGALKHKFERMLAESVEMTRTSGPKEIGFAELAAFGYAVDDSGTDEGSLREATETAYSLESQVLDNGEVHIGSEPVATPEPLDRKVFESEMSEEKLQEARDELLTLDSLISSSESSESVEQLNHLSTSKKLAQCFTPDELAWLQNVDQESSSVVYEPPKPLTLKDVLTNSVAKNKRTVPEPPPQPGKK